tara:strand:- start:478 stop:891 length:414 start_codon:yes stop_codon:yes gene_type:complete
MTKFTKLYQEIRDAEAQAVRDEIAAIKLNSDHMDALHQNTPKVAKKALKYVSEDYDVVPSNIQEAVSKSLDKIDHQNWLDEKYSYISGEYGTQMYLHKSGRKFYTDTSIQAKDAYSIKRESGLSWKEIQWIFSSHND